MKLNKKCCCIGHLLLWQLVTFAVGFLTTTEAMPPHPERYEEPRNTGKTSFLFYQDRRKLLERGVDAPSKINDIESDSLIDSFRLLAIAVEFSDKPHSVAAEYFDTLLFADRQGTVTDYYSAVSYGQLEITTATEPSSLGWIQAPEEYSYYCDNEGGTGDYPRNSQKLCEDVIEIIDPFVDFSAYDNNNDGYVDGVILVHSGSGGEFTGNSRDIASHKWNVSAPVHKDGVYIFEYTVQPEYWGLPGDMTCGVFCHELGHIFGLPDLYDTDYSSRGIGYWSVMAYGCWLGPDRLGGCPARLDAWCLTELGFVSPIDITSNVPNIEIRSVADGGEIYRLWPNGDPTSEYFLVENRQGTGYDSYLPGDGLLIWHIDETRLGSMMPNNNEWYPGHTSNDNYGVALEQADGLYQLEKLASTGDTGDPFSLSGLSGEFSALTEPNSRFYDGTDSRVTINNISSSDSIMTADFYIKSDSGLYDDDIPQKPEKAVLSQNFPNPFNPETNIRITLPRTGHVTLNIYNALGQRLICLLNGCHSPGIIDVRWDGRDKSGNAAASGVYLYELIAGSGRQVKKMTLAK